MPSSIFVSIVSFMHFVLAVYGGPTQPTAVKDIHAKCPEKWTLVNETNSMFCIMFSNVTSNFHNAEELCEEMGGRLITAGTNTSGLERLTQVKEHILRVNTDYWIGLSKRHGDRIHYTWSNQIRATQAQVGALPKVTNYRAHCVYISGTSGVFDIGYCNEERKRFVCERTVECPAGRSGPKCERECHCMENTCEYIEGEMTCTAGCLRDWVGLACDTPRVKPEVRYYCVNSPTHGKYVKLWIRTNSVEYVKLQTISYNGELFPCRPTTLEQFTNPFGLITVKMTSRSGRTEHGPANVTCSEINEMFETDSNFKRWLVTVKENQEVFLENDAVAVITCDFGKADNLITSQEFHASSKLVRKLQEPESDAGDVSLVLVDAITGENLTELAQGRAVKLRAYFGQRNDSILTGVFPYNCEAAPLNEGAMLSLLDARGCPKPKSPISSFKRKGKNYMETRWFPFFSVSNITNGGIKFKCSFTLCFQGQLCEATCDATRRKRDATDREATPSNIAATRTIRVLPSIKTQQVINPKPESTGKVHYVRHNTNSNNQNFETQKQSSSSPGVVSQFSPLMYLNPITCSLFLFLLTIFLVMFVIFLRSLRKSVDNMRKEIEGSKSRDKFLQCGCLQQKEKEYISCQ